MRRKRRRASSSFTSSSSFSSRNRRALEIVFVFASLMSVFLSKCVFATPRGDENNNNNNNNNAFNYLRDALLMSSSSSNGGFETTGDGENRIWNVVQSFGENQESWAALQEAYVRIGRLSSHDGTSMTTTFIVYDGDCNDVATATTTVSTITTTTTRTTTTTTTTATRRA